VRGPEGWQQAVARCAPSIRVSPLSNKSGEQITLQDKRPLPAKSSLGQSDSGVPKHLGQASWVGTGLLCCQFPWGGTCSVGRYLAWLVRSWAWPVRSWAGHFVGPGRRISPIAGNLAASCQCYSTGITARTDTTGKEDFVGLCLSVRAGPRPMRLQW